MKPELLEVLVVTNEQSLGRSIASTLRGRGHEVAVVDCAEVALCMPVPDVLIADVHLEGIGGLELLERLLTTGATPRTILVTDQPTLEDCRRALRLGAADLISKPIRTEEILEAVGACAARASYVQGRGERFQMSWPATLEDAERTVRELIGFLVRAGVQPSTRARVAGACAEALDNAQRHAYGDLAGTFHVEGVFEGGDFVLSVEDEGQGFDPLDAALGPMRDTSRSGLARAASLCEDIQLETAPGRGTRLSMRFCANGFAFDEGDSVDLSEFDYLTPGVARHVLESLGDPEREVSFVLSHSLAVAVGRMLAGTSTSQGVQAALWS